MVSSMYLFSVLTISLVIFTINLANCAPVNPVASYAFEYNMNTDSSEQKLPTEWIPISKREYPLEGILLGKRNYPTEDILLGKREYPMEGILLGKREYPMEGILLGKRDYPTEGILIGKRNFRYPAHQLNGMFNHQFHN